jgi:hypothetical protein
VTAVGSIWAVKKIARRQAEINAAGWRAHARATAAGFGDMARSVADAAVTSKNVAMTAGQRAAQAYRISRDGVQRVRDRVRPSQAG